LQQLDVHVVYSCELEFVEPNYTVLDHLPHELDVPDASIDLCLELVEVYHNGAGILYAPPIKKQPVVLDEYFLKFVYELVDWVQTYVQVVLNCL